MSVFDFGTFANVKTSDNVKYLKPYTINKDVIIKSTEIKEGTSASGNKWKSLVITFGNNDGIHIDNTFFLDINDPKTIERGSVDMPNGGKRPLPSRWEQTSYKLAAIGRAFAADQIDKFNIAVKKIKTFDEFIKYYKSMLDKVVNKTATNMKLTGRNSNGHIYATLPNCVGIAQATTEEKAKANGVQVGEWYTWMVNPFGDNLSFTAYEESKRNELNNAKPTKIEEEPTGINDISDDVDFESLLA